MLLQIGFIGAGKVGKALGIYCKSHGLPVSGYYSRTVKSAQVAAALTDSRAATTLTALMEASDISSLAGAGGTLALGAGLIQSSGTQDCSDAGREEAVAGSTGRM